jgi:predicted lactoylglutathione lyase
MIKISDSALTLMVADMDNSIRFYLSIGFQLKQRWENIYAMMTAPGIQIGLHPGAEDLQAISKLSIGFKVEDPVEAIATLDREEIAWRAGEDGKSGIFCHFQDPDGTELYFMR